MPEQSSMSTSRAHSIIMKGGSRDPSSCSGVMSRYVLNSRKRQFLTLIADGRFICSLSH